MTVRTEIREKFMSTLQALGKAEVTKAEIKSICANLGISGAQWFTKDESNRVGRGKYLVPNPALISMQANVVPMKKPVEHSSHRIVNVITDLDTTNLIPTPYRNYVPFGDFDDIVSIVKSNRFFPVFITGHSGNGKTMSIEQACAKARRKFICVSMTPETDEGNLLGNYVLIDGNMEWRDGPVTTAARQGAVLCIDEIDYGAQNLSSLQRVLEGKPFMLKKKGELITPTEGFTVFATANTKGKGSDDGRYMFTNVLNEAFLERFAVTFDQDYPNAKIEVKIIKNLMDTYSCVDEEFAETLVKWAEAIRRTFADGGCDETITTRRMIHIVRAYAIFKTEQKAVELCCNRFDAATKTAFIDLYDKVANPQPEPEVVVEQPVATLKYEVPF